MAEALVSYSALHNGPEVDRDILQMQTGQRYYYETMIDAETRVFDNVGFDENVELPAQFIDGDCYTYAP